MVLYIVYMILATLVLASIVPLLQYIVHLRKNRGSMAEMYFFTQELLDYDTNRLSKFKNDSISITNRVELANRGWIRCPNGTIMTEQEFEERKREEYSLELP